ncbi:MAG: isopentenyl-diphosphate Delta-isomerase [Cyclobacteriaceae bacterium]|jgi:isopentenyl-diphosphate Delta-isomerase|nr:isopentenyl-diphosphate Delta-isomerase [Cyclobacteriaceae bacterium]
MEEVVVVDSSDKQIGVLEKLEAHKQGLLHRAISVLIFNSDGEILLQKRAANKYHSSGLWTNTCCSHPKPGEDTIMAATRRLKEEMGIDTQLKWSFSFEYMANFENGLIENELDHVFIGYSDKTPIPDPVEVADWCYKNLNVLNADMKINAEQYSYWFHIIINKLLDKN